MKRLRDEWRSNDPRLRAAARLVQAAPPVNDGPQRRRLVQVSMRQRRRPRAGLRPILHPILRPILIVAPVFLLGMAGARAMVDGGWQTARARVSTWLGAAPSVSRPLRAPVRRLAPSAPRAEPAPPPLLPIAGAPPPAASEQPKPARRPQRSHATARPASDRAAAVAITPPAAPNPEAALMLEAIAARRAGDLDRAGRLLARYRQEFPRGLFEEEALVLSIEAAASRPAEAEALSRLYLGHFPNGRFHQRVAGGLRAAGP